MNLSSLPTNTSYSLPIENTGQSTVEKLAAVRSNMKKQNVEVDFISSLDNVA